MVSVISENFLDKWARELSKRLSEFPGTAVEAAIKKPQRFRLEMLNCPAELENDPYAKSFLGT